MGIEAIVMGLIYLCLIVIAIYLVIWVLGQLGISIPDNIMKVLWVIVVLIAVLVLVRTVLPGMGIRLGAVHHGAVQYVMAAIT
jgi:hypothetical protein